MASEPQPGVMAPSRPSHERLPRPALKAAREDTLSKASRKVTSAPRPSELGATSHTKLRAEVTERREPGE